MTVQPERLPCENLGQGVILSLLFSELARCSPHWTSGSAPTKARRRERVKSRPTSGGSAKPKTTREERRYWTRCPATLLLLANRTPNRGTTVNRVEKHAICYCFSKQIKPKTEVQHERQFCKELAKIVVDRMLPHEKLSSRDVKGRCASARPNFAGPQLRRSFSLDPVVGRERVWVISSRLGRKNGGGHFEGELAL